MTSFHYLILGYAVGLAALWGYALALWATARRVQRRERRRYS